MSRIAVLLALVALAAAMKCPEKAKNDGCLSPSEITCDDTQAGPNCEPMEFAGVVNGCPNCQKCNWCPAGTDACCGGANTGTHVENSTCDVNLHPNGCQLLCGISTRYFEGGCNALASAVVPVSSGCPGDFRCNRYVKRSPPKQDPNDPDIVDCMCGQGSWGTGYGRDPSTEGYDPTYCNSVAQSDAIQSYFCVRSVNGQEEWLGGVAREDLAVAPTSSAAAVTASAALIAAAVANYLL